jgi:hypothetical protein
MNYEGPFRLANQIDFVFHGIQHVDTALSQNASREGYSWGRPCIFREGRELVKEGLLGYSGYTYSIDSPRVLIRHR